MAESRLVAAMTRTAHLLLLAPNARHVVDDGHRRERPDEPLMLDEIRRIDVKNENPAEPLQHGQMHGYGITLRIQQVSNDFLRV